MFLTNCSLILLTSSILFLPLQTQSLISFSLMTCPIQPVFLLCSVRSSINSFVTCSMNSFYSFPPLCPSLSSPKSVCHTTVQPEVEMSSFVKCSTIKRLLTGIGRWERAAGVGHTYYNAIFEINSHKIQNL